MKTLKILPLLALFAALSLPSDAGVIRFAAKTTAKTAKPPAKLAGKIAKFFGKILY
jgi:hypothetical protein